MSVVIPRGLGGKGLHGRASGTAIDGRRAGGNGEEKRGVERERTRRNERKERYGVRWDNPTSGQRRRSETADAGDGTTHGGKGVAMKLREGEEESETADRWKG